MSEMDMGDWETKYKPISNHLEPNASFSCGECGEGMMFETYGKEYEFVTSQPDNCIWTYLDGDEGSYIVQGWHFVNRIGYFITSVPFTDEDDIWVTVSLNKDFFNCDTCGWDYHDEEANVQWDKYETEAQCDNCARGKE
jgi:uncharacterized protein (DUF983 family)